MKLLCARFGSSISIAGAYRDGVRVRMGDRTLSFGRERAVDATTSILAPAVDPAPFELTDLGDRTDRRPSNMRLGWPGGGMTLRPFPRVAFFGGRYAAIVDRGSITTIDATTSRHVRLETELVTGGDGVAIHDGRLAIAQGIDVLVVELADLEAIVAGDARQVELDVTSYHPLRRPDAVEEGVVVWVLTERESVLVNRDRRQTHLYNTTGLERGMTIRLCDELWPDHFAAIEVPGRPRQELEPAVTHARGTGRLVRGRPRDPAVVPPAVAPTQRLDELDRLLVARANDPDDEHNRLVLADLLQDLGETYGTWLARSARAASAAKRRDALGPLAKLLEHVEYRAGMPWSATLVRDPPVDLLARAVTDLRLGMLTTLRIGRGPADVYAKLVGSPRAVALRCVDAGDEVTIGALIAANRDHLTHLHGVRLGRRAPIAWLARPIFDRVSRIESTVQLAHVAGVLDQIADDRAGVLARVPRHIVLHERWKKHHDLLEGVLARWESLPVPALTIDCVTLRRDAARTRVEIERDATGWWIRPLARWLAEPAGIALANCSDEIVRTTREAFAHVPIA